MRRIILALLLLTGMAMLTVPFWGPWVLQRVVSGALQQAGASELVLSVDSFGFQKSSFSVDQLQFEGLRMANAQLDVSYNAADLWRGELDQITLRHPELTLALPETRSATEADSTKAGGLNALDFPERLPFNTASVVDAQVTLVGADLEATFTMDAELTVGADGVRSLHSELSALSLTLLEVDLGSEQLVLTARGTSIESLEATVQVRGGQINWSDGSGQLAGLVGEIRLASVLPTRTAGGEPLEFASFKQGDLSTGPGTIALSYTGDSETDGSPLTVDVRTTALGGTVRIAAEGQFRESLTGSIRVGLDAVDLEAIAALFPQFDGEIQGRASGELALGLEGPKIVLLPGGLRLDTGTDGRFTYRRQGWLTQDGTLNPEAFVRGRDIVGIMQDPQGATALTELALQALEMSDFRLDIRQAGSDGPPIEVRIEGERTIQGVTVPVVLDVPIRGDVEETINAVFEFNARMRD